MSDEAKPTLYVEMSPTIGALAAALAKAQLVTASAPKDHVAEVTMKSGGKYTYSYADLAGVWEAGRAPLGNNGLAVVQIPSLSPAGYLEMTTLLLHSSGEFIRGRLENFPVPDKTPQGVGTAITYARRYSFGAMVGVVSEQDDDGGNGGRPAQQTSSGRPNNEGTSARGGATPSAPTPPGAVFPFGRLKGQPIAGAPLKDLEWFAKATRESLNNPDKAQYRAQNSALLDALEAEIRRQRPEAAGDDIPF